MRAQSHSTCHGALLDAAVHAARPLAEPLRNAAIYITGASGFLAANLITFLHELNQKGGLGLRLYASARRPIHDVRLFEFLNIRPDVEWQTAPVESASVPDVDGVIVIHTASYGSPRDYLRYPIETFEANTAGLIRLFRQKRANHLQRLVYFSSAEIYGQPPETAIPTPETYVGGSDPLSARAVYGQSKRMGEVLGACLGQNLGIPFTAARPWNIYGPGQRLDDGRVPMEFVRQALQEGRVRLASNGTPRRAFCYVWDAMRQLLAIVGRSAPVEAYNIGNGDEEVSVQQLAGLCAAACGLPVTAVDCDPAAKAPGLDRCAPDTRAVEALAGGRWTYTPLTVGLEALRDWATFVSTA